jgi:hypothetical protein
MPFLDFVPDYGTVPKDVSVVQIPIPTEPKSFCVDYFWSIPKCKEKKNKNTFW